MALPPYALELSCHRSISFSCGRSSFPPPPRSALIGFSIKPGSPPLPRLFCDCSFFLFSGSGVWPFCVFSGLRWACWGSLWLFPPSPVSWLVGRSGPSGVWGRLLGSPRPWGPARPCGPVRPPPPALVAPLGPLRSACPDIP